MQIYNNGRYNEYVGNSLVSYTDGVVLLNIENQFVAKYVEKDW